MAKMQYCGTGRRKSSVARVRLIPGKGSITINKKDLDDYFGMEILKSEVRRPLGLVGGEGKFDVIATVQEADPENRGALKAAGFLTRDPRMIERKKYGLKKARRASQFSKR